MDENKNGSIDEQTEGAFHQSLKRNNKQIRDDRATAIVEDAELKYRRKIEDLQMSIKKMKREQDGMIDLSPTNATSLVLASDFDSEKYVISDLDLGIKIRNSEISLEIAEKRFEFLFGKK
jgi:ribosomal protein L35